VGLGIQDVVAFSDIVKFENFLNIKIVVLYHSRANAALLKFQNNPQSHPQILYFYVQNYHYYAITNITAFLGAPCVQPVIPATAERGSTRAIITVQYVLMKIVR
jgi:hypothetical protein